MSCRVNSLFPSPPLRPFDVPSPGPSDIRRGSTREGGDRGPVESVGGGSSPGGTGGPQGSDPLFDVYSVPPLSRRDPRGVSPRSAVSVVPDRSGVHFSPDPSRGVTSGRSGSLAALELSRCVAPDASAPGREVLGAGVHRRGVHEQGRRKRERAQWWSLTTGTGVQLVPRRVPFQGPTPGVGRVGPLAPRHGRPSVRREAGAAVAGGPVPEIVRGVVVDGRVRGGDAASTRGGRP